jgi:hypothetical protein
MKVVVPKSLHSQIQKAQTSLFIVVVVACMISIFCLTSAKVLLSQGAYQLHVLNARHQAVKQLNDNIKAANQLVDQYNNVFENSGPLNVIGGKNDSGANAVPPDGDNARIVLDALPTSYDFPALVSSLSKILNSDNVQNISIGGTDQSATADNAASAAPHPVNIDVPVSGSASYADLQKLINDLERSIRPYDITNLQLSGTNASMTFSLQMNTYYQPAKSLTVTNKVVSK